MIQVKYSDTTKLDEMDALLDNRLAQMQKSRKSRRKQKHASDDYKNDDSPAMISNALKRRRDEWNSHIEREMARRQDVDIELKDILKHPDWADRDIMKLDMQREMLEDQLLDMRERKEKYKVELSELENELSMLDQVILMNPAYQGLTNLSVHF